jgi:demethylmenaquinone methyltransferase/2-methoxy-6-polyprenyl-1,4-benzoquinol methylase
MDYVELAHVFNSLKEPVMGSAVEALAPPPSSHGLDAGCGIGLQSMLLARAVGPAGHVTGLDLSPDFLAHAEELVAKAGLSERISFRKGDVRQLPFDDDVFDWAWSVDLVGYAPLEPLPLVQELVRVVKPGGSVAILAWSSERLLPGHPLLEAHLGATPSGLAPFAIGREPGSHFLRALGWFRAAGLRDCRVHTFAGGAHAPLSADQRGALAALFGMRWPGVKSELSQVDADDYHPLAEYQRLCRPKSPDYILDHPDYYAFFTYSMFQGKVV